MNDDTIEMCPDTICLYALIFPKIPEFSRVAASKSPSSVSSSVVVVVDIIVKFFFYEKRQKA